MSLRKRLSLVAAAAVGVAVALASLVCYLVVRDQLRSQVDDALRAQAERLVHGDLGALRGGDVPGMPPGAGGRAPYAQVIGTDGGLVAQVGDVRLPVDSTTRLVASGQRTSAIEDVHTSGSHLRLLVLPVANGAVELARPLDDVDRVLSNLRLILLVLIAGGVALAVALGRVAARRVLAPLAEVAHTAEHITETEDLTSRIDVRADDEVGQLATRFNAMLERLEGSRDALDESVRAQRQLVADASHELRTPVTSLRTNIEVLLQGGELSDEDRRRLMADVVEQSEELSALVGDLIDLARGDQPSGEPEDVRLDVIVAEAVARARRNSPAVEFVTTFEPVVVEGVPERLARALGNLLDNAARHSPPAGKVEVVVGADGVCVRDHGTGIDPADLPQVFDRFFRGANSRAQQGSGLGLAIVKQVAEQHGGSVGASNAEDGGAIFWLHLPTVDSSAAASSSDSSLPSGLETPAQEPEQNQEHRHDREQEHGAVPAGGVDGHGE